MGTAREQNPGPDQAGGPSGHSRVASDLGVWIRFYTPRQRTLAVVDAAGSNHRCTSNDHHHTGAPEHTGPGSAFDS